MKTFSAPIKQYKKTNKRSYLLKLLTPLMVAINYLTMMSVIMNTFIHQNGRLTDRDKQQTKNILRVKEKKHRALKCP